MAAVKFPSDHKEMQGLSPYNYENYGQQRKLCGSEAPEMFACFCFFMLILIQDVSTSFPCRTSISSIRVKVHIALICSVVPQDEKISNQNKTHPFEMNSKTAVVW